MEDKEINGLVFSRDNLVMTNSLIISKVFEKNHADVLRAIDNLQCSKDFRASNFAVSSYKSLQNKEMPMYEMTRDGFSILVMGFTGEKAMIWKEKYIAAFNQMEQTIRKQIEKPKDLASLLIEAGEELRKKDIIIKDKETKLIEANTQIAKAQPKLEVYETFMTSNGTMSMNDLAKILYKEFKIGRNKLFAFLKEKHVLLSDNLPYQRYIDAGYFQVVVKPIPRNHHDDLIIKTTLVTTKGAKYIRDLLKKESQQKEEVKA